MIWRKVIIYHARLVVDNIDTFSEELRRYQNRSIMPTSHGDFMDRAIRSLAKEIGLQIPIELGNSAVVKVIQLFYLSSYRVLCQILFYVLMEMREDSIWNGWNSQTN